MDRRRTARVERRTRRFSARVLLRRSLVPAAVIVVLALLYLGLSIILVSSTPVTAAPLGAGGFLVLLVLSLRGPVRRIVMRFVFGAWGEPDEVVRRLGHRLVLTRRLQRSLERVVTAREEERRRLRRDIHDGLGPVLAASNMRIELVRLLLDRDPQQAQALLGHVAATQREALADLRRLVEGLRPAALDQLGLVGAVRERADRFTGQQGLVVTLDAIEDAEPLPAAVEVAAYHIVSEALTNVVKHARARACAVRLWRGDGVLMVEVRDDGTGLPRHHRAGAGLHTIRERAAELGGEASAARGRSGGTVVSATLPLPAGQTDS